MGALTVIRIVVGAAANNEDLESQAVLEWSLRKHTERELEITWAQLSRDPTSPWYSDGPRGWQTQFWTTPFSGFRWAVPAVCGWAGEAIYTDSDVIFLADVGELWDQAFAAGKIVIGKGGGNSQRLCVSKWNCFGARGVLPALAKLQDDPHIHRGLLGRFAAAPALVQQFAAGDWNRLDLEPFDLADARIKALHYTGIPTQVQLKHALPRLAREGVRHWYTGQPRPHPRQDLQKRFDELLVEATAAGYGIERYRVERHGDYRIRQGR